MSDDDAMRELAEAWGQVHTAAARFLDVAERNRRNGITVKAMSYAIDRYAGGTAGFTGGKTTLGNWMKGRYGMRLRAEDIAARRAT